jgi:hypothetical protein
MSLLLIKKQLMQKIYLLLLILTCVACGNRNITADSAEKYEVESLTRVIEQNNLQEVYPDAQIAEGVDTFEEGTLERPYSILYPETPDQLLIIWQDETKRRPYQIYFEHEGKWKSKTGLAIGSTYEEVEHINDGPIKFYGFGWDYSGAVDWNDGKMEASNIRVFLAPVNAPPKNFYGDKIIEADPEEILNLKLVVRAVVFHNGD